MPFKFELVEKCACATKQTILIKILSFEGRIFRKVELVIVNICEKNA